MPATPQRQRGQLERAGEVFLAFLLLGLTSFGGPVAHLGYFRETFVARRRWLGEDDYAELVALCQFLPGPASSQVGIAIGRLRAGYAGAVAAWAAFTLPSVVLLLAFAYGIDALGGGAAAGALSGLKLAAVAVVAQAVQAMAARLLPDRRRRLVAVAAAIAVLLVTSNLTQLAVIGAAAVAGALLAPATIRPPSPPGTPSGAGRPWLWLGLFVVLLVGLPLLAAASGDPTLGLFEKLYRTGSLVFGGGHVVLPLLEAELVQPGLIGRDSFIAGYGAAQAVPGPLFAFAAYAGAMLEDGAGGPAGAAVALLAIYLPSFLLLFGALPLWQRLRALPRLRGALDFANAAVVGLLLAVLYDPVFLSAVDDGGDLALALAALALLALLRWPPWLVVLLSAAAGYLLAMP